MKKISLVQTVTHRVTFYEDDFENAEQFETFAELLHNDVELRNDCFFDNVDRDEYKDEDATYVTIEE